MKGHIRERSPGHWAIVLEQRAPNGKRKRKWHSFKGTKREAQVECSRLIAAIKGSGYIEPSKLTVEFWIDQWLDAGAPGRRRKKVSERTLERYGQLLRTHVKPLLGPRQLQKLQATEIDQLYLGLEGKIAARTAHHVHIVFSACLATAQRKGLISTNPMTRVEQVPNPEAKTEEEPDNIGEGLTEGELKQLVAGFEGLGHYTIVALAAATGARRSELLALRWTDLDAEKKTLRIERAWEQTKKFGLRLKPPKTKRGLRTIEIGDAIVAMFAKEMARHQRIKAGIPDDIDVDLSLIKLPANALMFPAVPETGEDFDFTKPRNPRNFSKEFARKADLLGFGRVRFHDLRGIHSTALLDAGIPVHTVAQRIGDDPAILLRSYTKRKRGAQANEKLSSAIAALTSNFLG